MVNINADVSIDITNNTPVEGSFLNMKAHYTESSNEVSGNGGTAAGNSMQIFAD